MSNYLALDIGGTNIKFGVLNDQGKILFKDKFSTRDDKQMILDTITLLARKEQKEHNIKGIAISAPGMIDADKGLLITAGALLSLYGYPLKKELEALTGLPVEVENDVNCVALAEKWLGKGIDTKHFICLTIGTGIGGAIIINDALYRGHNHMAGEFGFMFSKDINDNDISASILSTTASTRGGIIEAYTNRTGNRLTGEEIGRLYQDNDPDAIEVVSTFTRQAAIGIYNLIFALDPQKVLIGGAISSNRSFMELIRNQVNNLVKNQPNMDSVKLPNIETCQFNNDSGLIGALYNYKIHQTDS